MQELEQKKIIGLMSGTSCDSIDAAYCIINPDLTCKFVQGINYNYPDFIREKLFRAFSGNMSVKELCQLNFEVGKCFADASNVLINEYGAPDIIASHGQTIYHYPNDEYENELSLKSTLQIGESSVIAANTGCLTVSNFRESDISHG